MSYRIIIPARYGSTRLPGKPLLDIGGKPLLQHVFESACASTAESVIIATDDMRIESAAEAFGARVCMTAVTHQSGSERLAEVVDRLQEPDDSIIVNLQGDEFGMPVKLLDQVATLLANAPAAAMATLCEPIRHVVDWRNPNVVKVVCDQNGRALYFSRAPIPWQERPTANNVRALRHIGLYAYRAGYLRDYVRLSPSRLELCERLEQLRALYHGADIRVAMASEAPGLGIDTPADLEKARTEYANREVRIAERGDENSL